MNKYHLSTYPFCESPLSVTTAMMHYKYGAFISSYKIVLCPLVCEKSVDQVKTERINKQESLLMQKRVREVQYHS